MKWLFSKTGSGKWSRFSSNSGNCLNRLNPFIIIIQAFCHYKHFTSRSQEKFFILIIYFNNCFKTICNK
jgi:hypothetical protein